MNCPNCHLSLHEASSGCISHETMVGRRPREREEPTVEQVIKYARNRFDSENDICVEDASPIVRQGRGGYWVQAWVKVPDWGV